MPRVIFHSQRLAALFLFGLALSSPSSATAPPTRHPLACAPVFCVEVASRASYSSKIVRSSTELETLESTLVVKLQNGVDVTFHSHIKRQSGSDSRPPGLAWEYGVASATASGCLDCNAGSNPGKTFIDVAIRPMPREFKRPLSKSIDVCIWPLTLASKGGVPENHLLLGDKICVSN